MRGEVDEEHIGLATDGIWKKSQVILRVHDSIH